MGYDVLFCRDVQFFLPVERAPQALQALAADPKLDCGGCKTLEEALWQAGYWRATTDASGNVIRLDYEGSSVWEDTLATLEVIAPYVRPGSYVVLEGEDGYIWRWYFDGQQVIEQEARIVFDTPTPSAAGTSS